MPTAGENAPKSAEGGAIEAFRPENFKPVGTFALMAAVGFGMLIGWLFLYYAVFLPRGIIH
jgi:hypothetical protein